jgi:hypothetical protein
MFPNSLSSSSSSSLSPSYPYLSPSVPMYLSPSVPVAATSLPKGCNVNVSLVKMLVPDIQ